MVQYIAWLMINRQFIMIIILGVTALKLHSVDGDREPKQAFEILEEWIYFHWLPDFNLTGTMFTDE